MTYTVRLSPRTETGMYTVANPGTTRNRSSGFVLPSNNEWVKAAYSLFSLLSFLGTGENRERYHGVKIPPTNIQDYHLEQARTFADGPAGRLTDPGGPPGKS